MSQSQHPSGRYRFQGERPLDPNEGVHPEMVEDAVIRSEGAEATAGSVPGSPTELIAMQQKPERPERAGRPESAKVRQVLELVGQLDTKAWEDQQIALALVQQLERFHDEVVTEMVDDSDASHSQLACWAIDADRLMNCRRLLESVDLG
jgi:hypothetical protein